MDLLEEYLKGKGGHLHWSALHQYHKEDFEFVFDAEKKLIENAEQFIKGLETELTLKIENDQALQKKPANEQEEYYQDQYYEHHYGRVKFGLALVLQSQRKASILSIFSLIEGSLKMLCELVQDEFKFKIKVDDLSGGDYIGKSLRYLEKVYEIDISKIEPYYTSITKQRPCRNAIAHNNSLVDKNQLKTIHNTPGLRVRSYNDEHFLIIESAEYNLNLLSKAEKFFNKLVDLMEEKYKVLKSIVE